MKISTNGWWKIFGVAMFGMIMVNGSKVFLGNAEGMLFPVQKNVDITYVKEFPDEGYIEFGGVLDKVRNCDLVQSRWYITTPDGSRRERIDVYSFNQKIRNVEVGKNEFGPRRAYIDPELFEEYTYATTTHKCHPVFDTISVFYKGSKVR